MRAFGVGLVLWLLAPAPAAEVIVTVTAAESGEPLAGAEAALLLQYEGGSPGVEVHRVKTGADGVARIECPMPAGSEAWAHLFVRARGRKEWLTAYDGPRHRDAARAETPKLKADDRQERAIALERGPTVRGMVVDANDRPIAGATVTSGNCYYNGWAGIGRIAYGDDVYWPPAETTGPDGRFELWSMRTDLAGAWNDWAAVQASHPDHAPYCLFGIDRRPLDDDGLIDVVLRLDPSVSLDGIVMGDGLPVPDAKVEISARYSNDGDPNWLRSELVTDPAGGFVVPGLAPGLWGVSITAPRWRQHRADVEVSDDGGLPQVIELQPGESLEVTVVDADGKPAVERWVRFQTDTFNAGGHTDRAGKVILDGLPSGTEGQVRVSMGPTMTVKLPADPVMLRLQPAVPLRLQIRDGVTGAPIGGQACQLGWNDAGGNSRSCDVADDGRPAATIHPGEYTFSLGLPDRPRIWLKATVPENEDYPDIVLTVPRGERAFGKVTDAAGKPVSGAKIRSYARRWWPDQHETVSGDDGGWSLLGLAGDVSLFVAAEGYAPMVVGPLKLEESGGERLLDFRLERCGTIEGLLRGADGQPRPWRTVRAKLHGDTVFDHPLPLAITADDGSFRLENVPLGMVTVFGDGAKAEVAVSAGETSTVELVR